MKRAALTLAVLLLRLIYAPMRILPVKPKVAILSRQSTAASDDILLLQDWLRENHPDIPCNVLVKFLGGGIGGAVSYFPHMLRQMYHIATSRAVILDGYCIAACILPHKSETKIIQMWHAIAAVKKFGYQTLDREGGHSSMVAEVMGMHRNYDYVLSPGGATDRIFCDAFRVPEGKLLHMGLPRLDLIRDGGDTRREIREAYGIPREKEILLYVPTFRKGRPVSLRELVQAVDPDRFVLVIQLHPLEEEQDPETLGAPEKLQIISDRSRSSEEWLRGSDRVITDYSALGVEAALTGKPVYYYVYDIEEYRTAVGLNVDPEIELPGATAASGADLSKLLAQDYDFEALSKFRDKYVTIETDDCTARLGEFIYGTVKEVH